MVEILLANPRGFCAGVERAIEIVEQALIVYGAPVYVRHEIVHNKFVVETLKAKGALFVDDIKDIPEGAVTIFSAHGVSEEVELNAQNKNLEILDATCPLVTKVHLEAKSLESQGYDIILIGHEGHPEVIGTAGRVKANVTLISKVNDVAKINVNNPDKLGYVTQTTLSVDETREIINALKERFPNIKGPNLRDICYATQNRQNAVRELSKHVSLLLVIGAHNSSNSNRLRDLGEEMGIASYLINDENDIKQEWLIGTNSIGITAGASAPEVLVERVINKLKDLANITKISNFEGIEENMKFKLPKKLLSQIEAIM